MKHARAAHLAAALAVLAACAPTPPAGTARGGAPMAVSAHRLVDLSGVLLAPPSVLSNNGGSVISDGGSSVISNNGGSLIAKTKLRLAATDDWAPVASARISLLDVSGGTEADVQAVTTDAAGHFTLHGVPASTTAIVAADAGKAHFTRLVHPMEGADALAVDPATTLATEHLRRVFADTPGKLSGVPPAEFDQLVAQTSAALKQAGTGVDLTSGQTAADSYDHLASGDATLDQVAQKVAADTVANAAVASPPAVPSGPPATSASTSPSAGATPAPAPDTAPASSSPAPSPGPASPTAVASAPSPSPSVSPPVVFAVQPGIGATGSYLSVDGLGFSGSIGARFPGGTTSTAIATGPNHVRVLVPTNSGSGTLTLDFAGPTSVTWPYVGGSSTIGPFAATAGSGLVGPADGVAAVAIGNYVYVFGGEHGAYLATVQRAPVQGDGTLGPFSTTGLPQLGVARAHAKAVVLGAYLYVIGGYDGSHYLASIERAPIAADGSLGAFETAGVPTLATGRDHFTVEVIGDYLYVIGGYANAFLSNVERAAIARDGTLGAFSSAGVPALKTARDHHTSHVIGDYLWVFGGLAGSGYLNGIEHAKIGADGSLQAFTSTGLPTLSRPRGDHTSAVVGNTVYMISGSAGGTLDAGLEAATLSGDASLGSFAPVASRSLAQGRRYAASVVVNGAVLVIGGTDGATQFATVERAPAQ